MIKFKDDVNLQGITGNALKILVEAEKVWNGQGISTLVCTSALDGKHMEQSKHYEGNAVDLRIWGLNTAMAAPELQALLGDDYDVVVEKDHIHVEYDPD